MEEFNPEELEKIIDIDDTTILGYNPFNTARDRLPIFKASKNEELN